MQIPKDQIISLIEQRAGGDQAQKAQSELPDQVDHEQHADLLQKYGIDPKELTQKLGGL
jgi:DNA-binding protein H-NS